MDEEIDLEDDFEDYYDEKDEEKVEKKEAKTKATKKKKEKKSQETEIDLDLDDNNDNNDFDLDNDEEDSFKISGIVKYLVILVLGGLITIGLLYFGGFLSGAQDCPKCEICPSVEDINCPEPVCEECAACPEVSGDCPKLTSERCQALFGDELTS